MGRSRPLRVKGIYDGTTIPVVIALSKRCDGNYLNHYTCVFLNDLGDRFESLHKKKCAEELICVYTGDTEADAYAMDDADDIRAPVASQRSSRTSRMGFG